VTRGAFSVNYGIAVPVIHIRLTQPPFQTGTIPSPGKESHVNAA
jgi:hypothetical protein